MDKRPQFTKDFGHDVVLPAKTSGRLREKVAEGRSASSFCWTDPKQARDQTSSNSDLN